MAESRLSPEEPLQFHGGLAGAFAPLLLFALAVTCVTAAGMISGTTLPLWTDDFSSIIPLIMFD